MRLEDMLFKVIVIDGHFLTVDQCMENNLMYEGLTWEEASELMRMSFNQGFEAVIWRMKDE